MVPLSKLYIGGFLVTQGVYTGVEDFKEKIVRQLMVFPPRTLLPWAAFLRLSADRLSDD